MSISAFVSPINLLLVRELSFELMHFDLFEISLSSLLYLSIVCEFSFCILGCFL